MVSMDLARLRTGLEKLPTWVAVATLLLAGAVLTGWLLQIEWLYARNPERVTMKANTALGFLLCALLLLVARYDTAPARFARWSLSALLLTLALLTLVQYFFQLDLGIDQLLAEATADEHLTAAPGRMSPMTAFSFGLLGGALLLGHRESGWGCVLSRVLATLVLFIAMLAILGYLYTSPALYQYHERLTAMAFSTALLLALLAVGVIWLRPKFGFPALLTEESLVGTHVRAVLPTVIFAPLVIGAAVSAGYDSLFFGQQAIVLTSIGAIASAATVALVSVVVLRRAASALNMRDRALAAATNGVIITDHRKADEPIVFVNEAFTSITGYSAAEAIGNNCRFLNQGVENPPECIDTLRQCVASGTEGTVEFMNRCKDGSTFWNRLNLAPVVDYRGNVTHFVGIIDDASDQKAQEERLQQALDDARAANQLRDTFVRLVSHELRTPLNAALTWLRLMEVDDRAETQEKGLATVVESIESQSRLIDDLVDATRFTTVGVRLEAEAVDMRQLVESTLEELRPSIELERSLSVEIAPGDYQLTLDPLRVKQILRNLVTNAVKYTEPGGHVRVDLESDVTGVRLQVRDDGKGLSESQLTRVFDPFWRADDHTPGLGVGLSIASALVEAHAGNIAARSDGPGQGCTFDVFLPNNADPPVRVALTEERAAT